MRLHTSLPLPGKIQQMEGLQVLRAVAVILVVWLHGMQHMAAFTGVTFPTLGTFGVDIFFVISGFIVSAAAVRSKSGLAASLEFLKRRAIRIYPIFWLLGGFQFVALDLRHGLSAPVQVSTLLLSPPTSFPAFLMLVGVAWTLYYEAFFYGILGVVLLFTSRRADLLAAGILTASVLSGVFLFDIRRPVLFVVANPMLLEFVLGAAIAYLLSSLGGQKLAGRVLLVAGVLMAAALVWLAPLSANGMPDVVNNTHVFTRVLTWGIAAALLVGGTVFTAWSPHGAPEAFCGARQRFVFHLPDFRAGTRLHGPAAAANVSPRQPPSRIHADALRRA